MAENEARECRGTVTLADAGCAVGDSIASLLGFAGSVLVRAILGSIFSSASSQTALLAGRALLTRRSAPFVAELVWFTLLKVIGFL